jgi:mRNA interferase RelE/StbE
MAKYRIEFTQSAVKELGGIPKKDVGRIVARVRLLADNPRLPGSMKLSAEERYRVRQGRYRILDTIDDETLMVIIVKIAHRRDVYR